LFKIETMTRERYNEIVYEAQKRVDLWLDNSTFEEMTCQYSMMRFDMALGLNGYPFELEKWMNPKDFTKFVNDEEFEHPLYDHIINTFFEGILAQIV
tara:strand:+ start:845 stop:1135 length:291 start_codon:yes stop_codon:yes gene_type:complete